MVVQNEIARSVNPLDLWDLFVNQIAGDPMVFVAFSFLIIAIVLAKLKVPNQVSLILFIVYGLIISPYFQSVLVLSLIAVAFFMTWSMSKMIGRIS